MMEPLTDGAIVKMNAGDTSKELQPVLQIFDLKMVSTPQSAVDRYRAILSDGTHLQHAMLATQKNYLVSEGRVKKGTVVRMTEYSVNNIQHRLIIIVCDMIVIMDIGDIIGDPKPFSSSGAPASAPTTPNMAAGSLQNPRMDSVNNSSYGSNADTGRYPSENRSGSYGNQSPGVQNFGVDVPRGNTSSYRRPSQPPYQQPPSQLPYQQPPPMYSNRGPVAKNEAPSRIIPIAVLTPYTGRWTIKARVTAKGELRHYNNARGDGKVFSFDLLDSDGGEIRVTCFNAVADQFYNTIEPGRVYVISKGSLIPAQKNYNHLRNDYEIFLESTSTVQPCLEDDTSIHKQQFHFCPISDIECKDKQLNPLYCIANLTRSPPSSPIASPSATPIAEELPTEESAVESAPPVTDDWVEWRERVSSDIADLRSSLARLEDFAREADTRACQESERLRTTLLSIIRGASAPVVAPPDDPGPSAPRVASPLPSAPTTRPGEAGTPLTSAM
ncbi:unnamed protein product [Rhodiola kirilowii]